MTKPLTVAAAVLAVSACAEEPAETATPIDPTPAEVVAEPTDDAMADTTGVAPPVMNPPMSSDGTADGVTEGETTTDDGST